MSIDQIPIGINIYNFKKFDTWNGDGCKLYLCQEVEVGCEAVVYRCPKEDVPRGSHSDTCVQNRLREIEQLRRESRELAKLQRTMAELKKREMLPEMKEAWMSVVEISQDEKAAKMKMCSQNNEVEPQPHADLIVVKIPQDMRLEIKTGTIVTCVSIRNEWVLINIVR